jgi:hypothetical protein
MPSRLFLLRPPIPPQSDDPVEIRRYHADAAKWHFKVACLIAVLIIAGAWALTPAGFARAGEVKQEIQNVKNEVESIKNLQKVDSSRLAKALSNTVAADIRFLQAKRCKETNQNERERLWNEIELKQDEYLELRSTRYEVPSCSEI